MLEKSLIVACFGVILLHVEGSEYRSNLSRIFDNSLLSRKLNRPRLQTVGIRGHVNALLSWSHSAVDAGLP